MSNASYRNLPWEGQEDEEDNEVTKHVYRCWTFAEEEDGRTTLMGWVSRLHMARATDGLAIAVGIPPSSRYLKKSSICMLGGACGERH